MPFPSPAGMKLTAPERRWAQAVFETLLPSGADPRLPIGARDVDMVGRLERLLSVSPLHAAWGARMAFVLIQALPPFLAGEMATFRGLTERLRERVLQRCAESPVYILREAMALVKTVALMAYFDDPRTVQAIRRSV
ncbi:MAG: hypothetical protein AAB434_10150 [Planctomycetota bacterium]